MTSVVSLLLSDVNVLVYVFRNDNAPGFDDGLLEFDLDEGLAAPFPQTIAGVLDQLPDIEVEKDHAPPPEHNQRGISEAGTHLHQPALINEQ